MPIIVSTETTAGSRSRIEVNGVHEMHADLDPALGGDYSAPSPHDYFDSALGACKAVTLKLYAQRKGIPLQAISVEVVRGAGDERTGRYALQVNLELKGPLTDAQRQELYRAASHCPVHTLMTSSEISIETQLVENKTPS